MGVVHRLLPAEVHNHSHIVLVVVHMGTAVAVVVPHIAHLAIRVPAVVVRAAHIVHLPIRVPVAVRMAPAVVVVAVFHIARHRRVEVYDWGPVAHYKGFVDENHSQNMAPCSGPVTCCSLLCDAIRLFTQGKRPISIIT